MARDEFSLLRFPNPRKRARHATNRRRRQAERRSWRQGQALLPAPPPAQPPTSPSAALPASLARLLKRLRHTFEIKCITVGESAELQRLQGIDAVSPPR
jgi:hypothetical protein